MTRDKAMRKHLDLSTLSDEDIRAIHSATLEVLERTGVLVTSPRAREVFYGFGASVAGDRVRIPADLIEQGLQSAPAEFTLYDRDGEPYLSLGADRSYFLGVSDHGFILDPFTGSRREFVSEDYRMTARLVDSCSHLWGVHFVGSASDYPPAARNQVAFRLSAENTKKPLFTAPPGVQELIDVFEMAAVIAGDYDRLCQRPFVVTLSEPVTPLCFSDEATDKLILAAERGLPVAWYPAASAGTTAPCSPAGLLVLSNAEILAGLTLHQLAQPGAPFVYGAMPGVSDMGTLKYSYGSPDFALHLAAATDLAHSYGLPMFGTAGCSDALSVDLQAAAEATVLCLMAELSGADLIHDVGYMGGNTFLAPEMMVLCDEIIEMVSYATRGVDTSPEELAVDLIDEVGPRGHYVATDHTLANFRRFWYSDVFVRENLPGIVDDEPNAVRDRVNSKTRAIIESHKVEPLPDEILQQWDELEEKWLSRVE